MKKFFSSLMYGLMILVLSAVAVVGFIYGLGTVAGSVASVAFIGTFGYFLYKGNKVVKEKGV